ncbi:sensor histidine kinase [Sulfurospirillum arcachonense]|uniref:sensor histidine kinase n=1 Tax=Sulfurospirillum arcachonense TaxID=57666 RepID=UPI0004685F1B|nr:cache domain-containing protein [Sulfurospirillum arcachonense]
MKKTITQMIFSKVLFVIFSLLLLICFGWFSSLKFNTQADINELRENYIEEQKRIVKDHVDISIQYINTSREIRLKRVKQNLKDNIQNAYTFMENTYEKYHKTMPEKDLKELITSALRKIRFLNGRGYYYISNMDGLSIMHGKMKSLENTNLSTGPIKNVREVQAKIVNLLLKQNEGFLQYKWFRKNVPDGIKSKKIAYVKYFKPYNWYIGAGDYIEDIEEELKSDLLDIIGKIRFGTDGFIFVATYSGVGISHPDKTIEGKDSFNLRDKNGFLFVQELIKVAKSNKDGGYVRYIGPYRPETGKPGEKITYTKGVGNWDWFVGSGLFIEPLESELKLKEEKLNQDFMYVATFLFFVFAIIGLIIYFGAKKFSKNIDESFHEFEIFFAKTAENNVSLDVKNMEFVEFEVLAKHTNELVNKIKDLNQNLEAKVAQRTQELKHTNKTLEKTLSKLHVTEVSMLENEKMAALGELVAGVTHEINTPVGLSLTGITHFSSITKNLKQLYESDSLSQDEFEGYVKVSNELADTITLNLKRAAEIIKSFKTVAIDQTSQDKREINVKEYFEEVLLSLRNKTKKSNIDFKIECDNSLTINTYPGALSHIITNLVINSIVHGFINTQKGEVIITVKKVDNNVNITYKDDGVGIPASNLDKIFNPFFTTKKGNGGSGLGLNIIYKIITDELHGKIRCESKENEGAIFYITFPLT